MAHLYIADGLAASSPGAVVSLTGGEARHAASVSRLRVGELVLITNGSGLMLEAQATSVGKDRVDVVVISVVEVSPVAPELTLIQALAKGDRDERAIEMATELGVSAIIPWQASRSVSRWEGDKLHKGRERWTAIVREASKQSVRAWIPLVSSLHTTNQLVSDDFEGLTFVLDPSGAIAVSEALGEAQDRVAAGIRIVVGPEGGLTEEEIATFARSGAMIVGLGTNILRTSTAGPAVIAVINEILRRW